MMKKAFSAIFILCAAAVCADTMWLVTPELSYSRRMLTHHCGDAAPAVEYAPAGRARFGVLRVGDRALMNSRGVCIVAQEISPHFDREEPRAALTDAELALRIAGAAPDAPAAVREIRKTVKAKNFKGGAVFLVSDPRRAFAVECSPGRFDAMEINDAYCVYSHTWRLPALFSVLHLDLERLWLLRARETMLGRKLAERVGSQGVSFAESAELARLDEVFGNHGVHLGPYGERSSCSALFAPDDEFPEVMSAVYISAGSPRHSPHLPIALGVAARAKLPDKSWHERAEILRRTAGDDPEFAAARLKLENKLYEEFRRTRMGARHKLRRSGRREALKMLSDLQRRQAGEIQEFMDEQIRKYSSRSKVRK